MSTNQPRQKVPEKCPVCGGPMTVILVAPVMFSDGIEDVTYKCQKCSGEIKRTIKGRSY